MAALTEGKYAGEFLVSEANGKLSREVITIADEEGVLVAGAVLACLNTATVTADAAAAEDEDNTGDGVMTLAEEAVGDAYSVGDYTVICSAAPSEAAANDATFDVYAPGGERLADATQGVAYAGQIAFTIGNATAVDFAVGDVITVTVSETSVAGSGEYVKYEDSGLAASAILWDGVDATESAVSAVAIVRNAEVAKADLDGIDDAGVLDLASRNIVCR
jgi:hypothetical protein